MERLKEDLEQRKSSFKQEVDQRIEKLRMRLGPRCLNMTLRKYLSTQMQERKVFEPSLQSTQRQSSRLKEKYARNPEQTPSALRHPPASTIKRNAALPINLIASTVKGRTAVARNK